jgi:hypothetical protein
MTGLIARVSGQDTGTPARWLPSFIFYSANGKKFTGNDIPKNRSTLFLFVDPGCDHCQKAVHFFSDHSDDLRSANVCIISLSPEPVVLSFLKKWGSSLVGKKNVLMLHDKDNRFISLFKPRKYPGVFLYNKRNELILYEDNTETLFRFVNELKKKELKTFLY